MSCPLGRTVKPVVKVSTQTSAPGNEPRPLQRVRRARGLTLLELLVVLMIVAIASAGFAWATRGSDQRRLQEEAERLAALLETARAQARAQTQALRWRPQGQGFEWLTDAPASAPANPAASSPSRPSTWLHQPAPQVEWVRSSGSSLLLGPEPILPAQTLRLVYPADPATGRERLSVELGSDGLSAIQVLVRPAP